MTLKLYDLKIYGGVMCHDNDTKIEEELTLPKVENV